MDRADTARRPLAWLPNPAPRLSKVRDNQLSKGGGVSRHLLVWWYTGRAGEASSPGSGNRADEGSMLIRVIVSLSVIVACSALQAGATTCDDAIKSYNAGEYEAAEKLLRASCRQTPSDAASHYYLANTLVHLKQHEEAIEQYRVGYALDREGRIGNYCGRALKGYGFQLPDAAVSRAIAGTVSGVTSSTQKQLLAITPPAAPISMGGAQPPLNRSVTAIRKQVEFEKQKNESVAEATAADAISLARTTVRSVRENAEQQIQRLYAPQRGRPALSPEEIAYREQQIRNEAKAEEDFIMRQAATKADRYRKVGEMRRSALDQIADNLETQLSDDGKYSGVKLIPQGTNLYVRTYAPAVPLRPVPDAHGAVARIYQTDGGAPGKMPRKPE